MSRGRLLKVEDLETPQQEKIERILPEEAKEKIKYISTAFSTANRLIISNCNDIKINYNPHEEIIHQLMVSFKTICDEYCDVIEEPLNVK